MFELTIEERTLLKSLGRFQVRYMIVGLSSALLQNAPVVTQDIDLWVEDLSSENFSKAVSEVGGFYIPPGLVGMNPPMLGPGFLKVFDLVTHMHGLDNFEVEFSRSLLVTVSGIEVHILPLERIIVSKEAANREKDKAVLPALRATLALKQNL